MREYYPLLLVGGIIGLFATAFIIAYATMKDKKTAIGFDRNMKDGEIMKRLLAYARPYVGEFLLVGIVMLLSIAYSILSPWLVGSIEEMIKNDFEMSELIK